MEWRCAWCGKPHEENDPPCDNCGHGEFERAVVPIAPESEGDSDTMTVWVCTECGHEHPKHTPPCDRCGGGPLERREVTYDEDEVMAEMLADERGENGPSADVGYLDVLDWRLVLAFLGVAALVAILTLGFLGVVHVPGVPNTGPVPGNASSVDGLSLTGVEHAYVAELNRRRQTAGYEPLSRDDQLSSAATWYNQQRVRHDYGDGTGPGKKTLRKKVGDACGDARLSPIVFSTGPSVGRDAGQTFENETEMGRALVGAYRDNPDAGSFADASKGLVGVDVHVAPDGKVYVTQFVC